MNMKQPQAGILATIVVIVLSLGFVSLFAFQDFAGWIGFYLTCCVAVQTPFAIVWQGRYPHAIARLSQPLKGVVLTFVTALLGVGVTAALFVTVGASASPPNPMVVHYIILCVILSFLITIMWGGWPLTAIFEGPLAKGASLFAIYFALGYAAFRFLFNYEFLKGTPVYVAASDPGGLLMGWIPLTCCISVAVGMFTVICFDMWPIRAFPKLMRQPLLGVVWTALAACVAAALYSLTVGLLHLDVVVVMTRVAVPFIFGFIVVLFMLQGKLWEGMGQPLRGILKTGLSMGLGYLLSLGYIAVAPWLSGPLASGPPAYDLEVWNATALLSVTFPFLTISSSYFDFWPFMKPVASESEARARGQEQAKLA